MAKMVTREAMMVIFLVLQIATSIVQVEAAMDIQFNNDFQYQQVEMHCNAEHIPGGGGSLGHHTLDADGGQYMFTIPGAVYSKDLYRCKFQTYQNTLTYIDVFIGFGGFNNQPCYCPEGQCVSGTSPTGISFNHDIFVHKW